MSASFRTPTIGLGTCISQQQFIVPNHQRDYSWTVQNVKTFLEDIERELDANKKIYFCGLMVFTQSSSKAIKVLDGQQRLATTLMIFSGMRNWLNKYGAYKETSILIETQLLTSKFIGRQGVEAKLTLTPPNNQFFQKFVTEAVTLTEIEKASKQVLPRDRSKNLMNAIVHVNRRIEEIANVHKDDAKTQAYFVRLIEYLSEEVRVVELVLDSDAAAYTIFETLNDRGLELAPLDLIKNYLFSKASTPSSSNLLDLEARWAEMMTLLGSVKADSFLRAFWASRHSMQEGTKLFRDFKKQYPNSSDVVKASLAMKTDSERYSAIFNDSDVVWEPYSDSIRKSIRGISIIDPSQLYSIILAALEKFDKQQMPKLVRLLEIIGVRYQLVKRGRPGRMESLGAQTARAIRSGEITTTREVRLRLDELYVPDNEFKDLFKIKSEKDPDKAKYLLLGLERQSILRDGSQFADELDGSDVLTLEHIFPKSYRSHWSDEVSKDEDLPKMINRLGNMCLLAGANHRAANKSFSTKAEVYRKSRLRLTNRLTTEQYSNWDANSIEKRQGFMADMAVSEWRWE